MRCLRAFVHACVHLRVCVCVCVCVCVLVRMHACVCVAVQRGSSNRPLGGLVKPFPNDASSVGWELRVLTCERP